MTTLQKQYTFSTPYGFHCLGGGRYYASYNDGVNTNREGYAYEVDEAFFEHILYEVDANSENIKPIFDETIGL